MERIVGKTTSEPAVGFVPVHAADAVQEVTFAADHASVADWPTDIVEGVPEK